MRITAQLIDAATNNHIWADRYDGELTDVFELQDEITKKVVSAIEPKLLEAEAMRSKSRSAEDLGAWDLVMRANSLFWRLTKEEGEAAIAILRRAVERYPKLRTGTQYVGVYAASFGLCGVDIVGIGTAGSASRNSGHSSGYAR